MTEDTNSDCFIIMPISDTEGYSPGHFRHVYNNIIKPSCEAAGVKPIRADDVNATNLIHLDILKRLIDAPVAVCDLSSRNPNVLFELGVRQAFDKPVVLIQEVGTPRVFDISPLRCLDYSSEMKYHDVLNTQRDLAAAIAATIHAKDEDGNVNSIVRLLALRESAKLPDVQSNKEAMALSVVFSEIQQIKDMLEKNLGQGRSVQTREAVLTAAYERLSINIERIISNNRAPIRSKIESIERAMEEVGQLMNVSKNRSEYEIFKTLMERGENFHKQLLIKEEDNPF